LFVTGYGTVVTVTKGKQTTQQYWYVRRSLDGGATWSTVDAYAGGQAKGIGADAPGNIYAVGANGSHWIVRKSTNGGASWATVDDFYPCITTSAKPVRTTCYAGAAEAFAADSR